MAPTIPWSVSTSWQNFDFRPAPIRRTGQAADSHSSRQSFTPKYTDNDHVDSSLIGGQLSSSIADAGSYAVPLVTLIRADQEQQLGELSGVGSGIEVSSKNVQRRSARYAEHAGSRRSPTASNQPSNREPERQQGLPALSEQSRATDQRSSSQVPVGLQETGEESTASTNLSTRTPLWIIWGAILIITIAIISFAILCFATVSALHVETAASAASAARPRAGDPGYLLAVQTGGWQITNVLAGLIPACTHARKHRKWLRMTYAWIPAAICLLLATAGIPIYLYSPAMSAGLAGASNLPLGFFIFFTTYEVLREEKHMSENGVAMQTLQNGRVH